MAKRKAGNSEDGAVPATNRRSSRRKTVNMEVPMISMEAERDRHAGKDAKVLKQTKPKTVKTKDLDNVKKEGTKPDTTAQMLNNGETTRTQRYWLMKAEPESRLEDGHDVKFSIDDLRAKREPEPWDGIRSFAARNNLRAMRKGDLAFFYHSNCKDPAIVGIMEIVRENSPDFSAQDPKAHYYDPKDNDVSNPKWSVVHVEFRTKFDNFLTLKELKELATKGGALENMQMLRQSRLSVSAVTKEEWDFIVDVIAKKADRED